MLSCTCTQLCNCHNWLRHKHLGRKWALSWIFPYVSSYSFSKPFPESRKKVIIFMSFVFDCFFRRHAVFYLTDAALMINPMTFSNGNFRWLSFHSSQHILVLKILGLKWIIIPDPSVSYTTIERLHVTTWKIYSHILKLVHVFSPLVGIRRWT